MSLLEKTLHHQFSHKQLFDKVIVYHSVPPRMIQVMRLEIDKKDCFYQIYDLLFLIINFMCSLIFVINNCLKKYLKVFVMNLKKYF